MKTTRPYEYNGGFKPTGSLVAESSEGEGDFEVIDEVEITELIIESPDEAGYYFPVGPDSRDDEVIEAIIVEETIIVEDSGPQASAPITIYPEFVPDVYSEPAIPHGPDRPLTMAHVGPYLLRGGAEQWFLDLTRSLDPGRLQVVRAIATHGDLLDVDYATELAERGVTVEVGRSDSIRAAAQECDVLVSWGVELDEQLDDVRAPMSIHVVHGDGPANRRFLNGSLRSIDHVVAVSHRVRKHICDGLQATVIYNGVDTSRLLPHRTRTETRARLGLARNDLVVGYFGRMAREKRVDVIIDAVAALPERFKLLAVGWGPLYPELQELARRKLPGRHQFTYATTALGDLYRAVDAVCLASNQEGFPLVMLEAMSCGRPFLTTPVGCAREIIDDRVNGILFDGTASSLSRSLWMLARYPAWRRGVGRSGRRTFARFGSARRMARDYEHLVSQLWAEKHAS